MNIDSIKNGVVIDHITAGRAMELYSLLNLGECDGSVALINNVSSRKMGKKDIIKIDSNVAIDVDVLGYVDPDVTVNIIKDGVIVDKKRVDLPKRLCNVVFCKNPRCITSTEQELPHIFNLTDRESRVYRCLYCETKAENTFK
jgi:aspartate carbamoyltransferase regulatory subunit